LIAIGVIFMAGGLLVLTLRVEGSTDRQRSSR